MESEALLTWVSVFIDKEGVVQAVAELMKDGEKGWDYRTACFSDFNEEIYIPVYMWSGVPSRNAALSGNIFFSGGKKCQPTRKNF